MSLTVCICTMNRPEELRSCLASIRSGSEQPDAVVVSDDGTDPTVAALSAAFGATYVAGPRRGLGPNRNACIRAVTTSHLAFIDDDVVVGPDFVACARRAEGAAVVTGYERRHTGAGVEKVTASNPSFLGYQEVPITPGDRYRAVVINATVFPTALFRRARFDENIRYGSEEVDMARQAVALGYPIRYDERIWVHHHPSEVNRAGYQQVQLGSLLYLTLRSYWRYERSVGKALAYLLYAPARHYLGAARRGTGIGDVSRGIRLAVSYCRADAAQEGWRREWSGRGTGGGAQP